MGCKVENCDGRHEARGYCPRHYHRWRVHGDPLGGPTNRGAPLEFVRAAAEGDSTGCVVWPFHTVEGYGRLKWLGTDRLATHVVLELSGRPRPPAPGDRALHSCDNPPCVNPHHLRWGTQAENLRDALDRERAASVIDARQADEIRERYRAGGVRQVDLADAFGISQAQVSRIVNGQRWR